MNYSQNLRKAAIAKRVIISWVIVALVGVIVGGVSGYTIGSYITGKKVTQIKEQVQNEVVVYGSYDNRIFTQENSLDWGAGDLEFTQLDCSLDAEVQEFVYYLCTRHHNLNWSHRLKIFNTHGTLDFVKERGRRWFC